MLNIIGYLATVMRNNGNLSISEGLLGRMGHLKRKIVVYACIQASAAK